MTQTKEQTHTPGPWELNGDTITGKDTDLNRSPIATVSHFYRNREIDQANARLIAAAPELLEALEQAKNWIYTHLDSMNEGQKTVHDMKVLHDCWDAIAKAEGRA
jgi:hypothetical protein